MTLKEKLLQNIFIVQIIASLITVINYVYRIFILNHSKNQSVLIISLHKLGDTVLTIPAIKLLLKQFNHKIFILCYKPSINLYQRVFNDLVYICVEENQISFKSRIIGNSVINKIKQISPSTIIDITGSITSASIIFKMKSKNIIGINEEFYRGLYTRFIPIRKNPHLIDIYLDVVQSLSPKNVEDSVREFPIKINREGDILIHPFAGWSAKEWNFNKFLDLYSKLEERYFVKFVFEKNKLATDIKLELNSLDINFIETEDIPELMNVLSNSSLFISNDSGPIHIASMMGVPTFGIYGPTNPNYHVPIGKYHRYINKIVKCSPKESKYCFTFGGRFCPTFDCMYLLDTEEVLTAVSEFINELGIYEKGIN
jgi:heptosyltransferase-2